MINLERLAANYFYSFAKKTTPHANWNYLSKNRQESYKKEVAQAFLISLEQLEKSLDKVVPITGGNASFEKGFIAGEIHENNRIKYKIELLKSSLLEQLEDLTNENN